MAIQENFTITSPAFSTESAGFTQAIVKEQKKQQKELLHLGTVLKLVEEEVEKAKHCATSGTDEKIVPLQAGSTNANQGPSNTAFENAMDSMVLALQMLQVLLAKFNNKKTNQEEKIAKAYVKLAQTNLEDIQKKLNEIKEKQEEQKTASTWEKIAEGTIGAVTVIAGFVLAQPELIVMGVLSLAAAAGAYQWVSEHVADLLEGLHIPGVSRQEMQIAASILVCVAVVALSITFCNFESAAEETAETGVELGEQAAEDTAQTSLNAAEETAEESTSTIQNIKNVASKIVSPISRISKALGPTGRIALLSILTSVSNTEVVQQFYDFIAEKEGVSEKERKKIERDIQTGLMVASLVASIFVGVGASSAENAVSATSRFSLETLNILRKVQKYSLILGSIAGAIAGSAQAKIILKEGQLQEELLKDQAFLTLLSTLIEMNQTQISEDQRHFASEEKNQQVGNKSITQLMRGLQAFANDFVYYSPV